MKKTFILLVVSLFVLTACDLFTPPNDPKKDMMEEFDLTEEEVNDLIETGIDTTDEIDMFLDELNAMGPGPFDYNAVLEDVSGGNATGEAGASYKFESYKLYAKFENLPHLDDDYFYEGWVVRQSPLSVVSTGEAKRNLGEYINSFNTDEDLTDHDFYVLTLEPNDGDPAPAEHILEGTMTNK